MKQAESHPREDIILLCYGDNDIEVYGRGKMRFSKSYNSRLLRKNRTYFDQYPTNVGKEGYKNYLNMRW